MVSSQAWTCCSFYRCWDSVVIHELRALVRLQVCCVHLTQILICGAPKRACCDQLLFPLSDIAHFHLKHIIVLLCVHVEIQLNIICKLIKYRTLKCEKEERQNVLCHGDYAECSTSAQDHLGTMIEIHKSHTLQVLPRKTSQHAKAEFRAL